MTQATVSAAISLIAPALSASFLYRRFFIWPNRLVALLGGIVTFQVILVVPVQILGACQILGFLPRVTTSEIAALQILILAAISVASTRLPYSAKPGAARDSILLPNRWIKWALIVSGSTVLLSHMVFLLRLLTSYPNGWDSLVYHLPLSLHWLQDGSLQIPESRAWEFSLPGNMEIAMMLVLAIGSQALTPFFSMISLVVLALSSYLIARRCDGSPLGSAIAVLLLISVPMFQFHAYDAYVDLPGTAFLMAGVALFLDRHQVRPSSHAFSWSTVLTSGLACGISIGSKPVFYVYVAVFLFMALVSVFVERRRERSSVLAQISPLAIGVIVPSIFWFWRGFYTTGNPVYPLQVSILGHPLLQGYPSTHISSPDLVGSPTSVLGWLIYPWKEQLTSYGVTMPPFGLDSGLGAAFATFVPLGLAFCLYRSIKRSASPETVVLLLSWLVMVGVWWFALRHYPRFGMPLWAVSCILTTSLLDRLCHSDSMVFPWLLSSSILVTCGISAYSPLLEMTRRLRLGQWTRSEYYQYPPYVDQLPAGSRVLNRATLFNFILAGSHLSNRVIPGFECPPESTSKCGDETAVDYLVESTDERGYHVRDSRAAAGVLVNEVRFPIRETGKWREWRIWRIMPAGQQFSPPSPPGSGPSE